MGIQKGKTVKKIIRTLSAIAGLTVAAGATLAADAPAGDAPGFDMGVEITGVTDYMDSGLTNSDHKPSGSITLSPSYGIFYGTIYAATIDYGDDYEEPKIESKFAIGATPVFGDFSVDFNLARRIKFDDPTADRWLPYVTGTYTFNDNFNASLGVGYYDYDESVDYWEFYAGSTVTLDSGAYFTSEFYWEPDSDGANNAYYETIGTLGFPFLEKFEAIGKVGYEGYADYDDSGFASYLWYEARLNYSFNDHVTVGVAYHGNDLKSGTECDSQKWSDCDDSVFATLTLKGNLSDLSK